MAWHYQSPSSHHQPSIHNHADSEYLRSVTRQNRISYHTRLANIPFLCAVNTTLVLSSLVHGKPTHPMVSSRMPCTPLRVCAPSPASQSGLAPSSMLSATVLVHRKPTRTHTHPVVSSRMPCTPLRVCAPSPASQSGLAPSSMLSATVLVHHTPTFTTPPSPPRGPVPSVMFSTMNCSGQVHHQWQVSRI